MVSLIEFCAFGNPGIAVNFVDTTYHWKSLTVEPLISALVDRESFLLKSTLNFVLFLKIDHNAFDSWKHKLTQLFGLNFGRRRYHYLRFLCMYLIAVFVSFMCFLLICSMNMHFRDKPHKLNTNLYAIQRTKQISDKRTAYYTIV